MKNETMSVTAPSPVRYYVGDLCYVMHDAWDEVCSICCFDNEDWEYELEDGRKFILFSTAYGDGQYNDQNGNPYAVDSGTIGAIAVDDIMDPEFEFAIKNGLGHIYEFPAEIQEYDCSYDRGVISIYSVCIDTAGDLDCDDDEDYIEEDDDCEDA